MSARTTAKSPAAPALSPRRADESPFQYRLRLGSELHARWTNEGNWRAAVEALRTHAFRTDDWSVDRDRKIRDRADIAAWEKAARHFMTPRCDFDVFPTAPGGRVHGFLRIWSPDGDVSQREFDRADALLARWHGWLGWERRHAIDLVVAKDLGRRRFPRLFLPKWAVGYYMPDADVAIVNRSFIGATRARIVQHELAHAVVQRLGLKGLTSFVEEGLATILEFCDPTDQSLSPPTSRMREELGWVREALEVLHEKKKLPDGTLAPWVAMTPKEFYSDPWTHYPLAFAAIASLGGNFMQQALVDRNANGLSDRVGAIRWLDLLEFVRREGSAGDRAFWVADAPPAIIHVMTPERSRRMRAYLLAARADVKRSPRARAYAWLTEAGRITLWEQDSKHIKDKTKADERLRDLLDRLKVGQASKIRRRRISRLGLSKSMVGKLDRDRPDLLVVLVHQDPPDSEMKRGERMFELIRRYRREKAAWPKRVLVIGPERSRLAQYWERVLASPSGHDESEVLRIEE